jgi:hypothetical protein
MKRVFFINLFLITTLLVFPCNISENSHKVGIIETRQIEKPLKYSGYQEVSSLGQRKISFKFSGITTNSDPGDGAFRYNRDSLRSVTYILLDEFNLSGEDQTDWYMQWKKAAGVTGKVRVNIAESEGKNINVFYIKGGFVRENGYWRIPAEYISGSMPVDGEIYYFEMVENKEPVKESQPIEPQIQADPSGNETIVPEVQSDLSQVNTEKQPKQIEPEQAAVESDTNPGQQKIAAEENKPEPPMQTQVAEESNPESAKSLIENEEAKPVVAAVGAVAVATQVEKPKEEPRVRTQKLLNRFNKLRQLSQKPLLRPASLSSRLLSKRRLRPPNRHQKRHNLLRYLLSRHRQLRLLLPGQFQPVMFLKNVMMVPEYGMG